MSKKITPKKRLTINPTSGEIEFVSDNNFSYEAVPENQKLIIRENNQMTVHEEFDVGGDLELHGSLILEE